MDNENEHEKLMFDTDDYGEPLFVRRIKEFMKSSVINCGRAVVNTPAFLFFCISVMLIHVDKKLLEYHKRWRKDLHNGIGDDPKASREVSDNADSLDKSASEVAPPNDIKGEGDSDQVEKPEESDGQSIQNSASEQQPKQEKDTSEDTVEDCPKQPLQSGVGSRRARSKRVNSRKARG